MQTQPALTAFAADPLWGLKQLCTLMEFLVPYKIAASYECLTTFRARKRSYIAMAVFVISTSKISGEGLPANRTRMVSLGPRFCHRIEGLCKIRHIRVISSQMPG